ncbi:hypothetical protein TNCV_2327281, partial [Trichonephila clavipes]
MDGGSLREPYAPVIAPKA